MSNPFDQFDTVATDRQTNPFDQFDQQPDTQRQVGIDYNAADDVVRRQIRALPEGQREQAVKEWARAYVAKERKNAWDGNYVSDTFRNLARGTAVGSWLDEANAATSGMDYDEALAYQRATDQAIDKESTKIATDPIFGGDITVGGLTKLVGGIATVPLMPVANIFKSSAFLPQAGNAAATGAGYGAVYGAGEGESIGDRAGNAVTGASVGAGLGIAGEAIGRGAASAYTGVKNARNANQAAKNTGLSYVNQSARPVSPGAINRVSRAAAHDFGPQPNKMVQNYKEMAEKLGDQGMLADMGQNLNLQAQGVATTPGLGQKIITDALRKRGDASQDRINAVVDQTLGQPVDLAQYADDVAQAAKRQSKPLYDEFRDTPIQESSGLNAVVGRAKALYPTAEKKAKRLIEADGFNLEEAASKNIYYDYIKRAMDDFGDKRARAGANDEARIASNISQDLRNEVDSILSPGNPDASVWKRARDTYAKGKQFEDGLEAGKDVFSDKVSANQFRFDQARRTPEMRHGIRMQAREDLRRRMATARSSAGNQDQRAGTVGRHMMSSPETRAKVAEIAGNDAARKMADVLDAEGIMASTQNSVLSGSQTAARLAAQKEIPSAASKDIIANNIGQKGLGGLALEGVYRIANMLANDGIRGHNAMIAEDIAGILSQTGANREVVAREILKLASKRGASFVQKQQILDIVNSSFLGATPTATGNAAYE